jgi:hypothetical protein
VSSAAPVLDELVAAPVELAGLVTAALLRTDLVAPAVVD